MTRIPPCPECGAAPVRHEDLPPPRGEVVITGSACYPRDLVRIHVTRSR